MMRRIVANGLVVVGLVLWSGNMFGQDVPIGTWRVHISFNRLVDILPTATTIYAAAPNGVMCLDKQDRSIIVYHKGNGLSNTGIVALASDPETRQLFIAYDDGTFDVLQDNRVRFFDPSLTSVITGPKGINDIRVSGSLAYLATDYGVLLYDLARMEIKETWRDLGEAGSTIRILGSAIRNDSIFLATESGIMAGNLAENLLDFNKWDRFDAAGLPTAANDIATVDQVIYASFRDAGLYSYEEGEWSRAESLPEETFFGLNPTSNGLVLTNGRDVWAVQQEPASVATVYSSAEAGVIEAVNDGGHLWMSVDGAGLLTNESGSFTTIIPNGPAFNETAALRYYDGKLWAVPGGYSAGSGPLNRQGLLSAFSQGTWSSEALPVEDITSIAFNEAGVRFAGSFGFGVLESQNGINRIWDESNSSLFNTSPPGRNVRVTDVNVTASGVWVANYDATPSLHFYDSQGSWSSFSFPYSNARYPVKLESDNRGNVWMVMNPSSGGRVVVFNKDNNEHVLLSDSPGQGGLPSNNVFEISNDRDGNVWVGTDAGVAYFFDKNSDAIKPIFENRFLLRDETVRAIAVDGGNRKWIGTERGVWIFNATGEQSLANYTVENSPLPSNRILDIEINPFSGEVFFATDRGIASFRAGATAGTESFGSIRIFPNPVSQSFNGEVGISGLATDAIVKITDVSGRLIRQTQANGGSASWDVKDSKGKRVDTGIYLVMAVAVNGSESMVGKIAVIN